MHFLCTPPACGGHWYSSLRHLNVVPVLPRTSCSTFAQILLLYIWIEATGLGLWIFKSCAPDSSRNDTCGILDALIIPGCHISLSSWQSLFIRKSKFSPISKVLTHVPSHPSSVCPSANHCWAIILRLFFWFCARAPCLWWAGSELQSTCPKTLDNT